MVVNVKDIIEVGKNLYNQKLVSGKSGNISIRVKRDGTDIIAITPTLRSLGDLNEEDIVLVDLNGNLLTSGTHSSELNLHLEVSKVRDDVNAIVHTHSPYATGFSFSSKKIKRLEGFGKIKTPFLKEIDYITPGSIELAKSVGENIGDEDVVVLKEHGILTVSENIKEAESLANFIEEIAKTQFVSHMLNLNDNK